MPGLIGPLVVSAGGYRWHRYENGELVPTSTPARRYELWDGGVYDNLGLEALYKPGGGFRGGFDFLLASDASAQLGLAPRSRRYRDSAPRAPRSLRRAIKPAHRTLRLVDVAMEQVRGLRARSLVAYFARAPESGAYLRMGNTVEQIYGEVGGVAPAGDYMSPTDVRRAACFATTLRRLSLDEFGLLCRHGFEVANATLATRQGSRFKLR